MPLTNNLNVGRITENTNAQIRRMEYIQDFGYNIIGGLPGDVIQGIDNANMIRDSITMWQKNPLANNIIETMLDYVFGDGVQFKAEDKQVQDVLEDYWFDTINDWDNKQIDRYRDLSLNGEMILETEVSPLTGKVRVYSIYPGNITDIKRNKRHVEKIESIIFSGDEKQEMKIINYSHIDDKFIGDGWYWAINKSTFQSRGISDLFVNRDWLNLHDKSLYANIERAGLIMSFVWDITIKGATPEQLKKKYSQMVQNPPKPGGFRVHDENEVWSEMTPNLAGRDFTDIYRLLKSQISGGSRQPVFMFGGEGEINRATAREMSKPWNKKVKRRQKFVISTVRQQFDYVLSKAIEHGTLSREINNKYSVTLPNPNEDIFLDLAQSINQFAQALTLLETNNMIDSNTTKAIINLMNSQLGIGEMREAEEDTEEMKKAKSQVQENYNKIILKK